jgi:hypothetical protein
LSLLIGTLVSLTRLPRRVAGIAGLEWVTSYSYMLRASLVAYMVGTLFLGLSYWDIFYHLVFIAVLVRQFTLQELAARAAADTRGPTAAAMPAARGPPHGAPVDSAARWPRVAP